MPQTLLIASFSRLEQDARVRRQIALFRESRDVVTLGFGPAPEGVSRHVEIQPPPTGRARRPRAYLEAVLLRVRAYRFMYETDPLVRQARRALRGVSYDAVLANDIETVPLALALRGSARVHADLHEFYPGLHDDVAAWVRLRKPYFEWLLRTFATRAASVTTVGDGVAEALRRYGVDAEIVTNAPRFLDRQPGAVHSPVSIVHAGAPQRGRGLEQTMRAVAATTADVQLTVHLTDSNPAYVDELTRLAEGLGPRIRMRPPVAQADLVETLSGHDIGIHVMPATVTNQAVALPNKFFDYVQARLGIIVGPTPGMARLVERHGLGAVTGGFDADAIRAVLDSLDAGTVRAWKDASNTAAAPLSAEPQLPVWERAIEALEA